jgi:hypothetical protein
VITHWDDVVGVRREQGHIAGMWFALTGQSSVTVGVRRIRVDPGSWSTPLHLEGSEEEIFFVLEGEGVSVQERQRPGGVSIIRVTARAPFAPDFTCTGDGSWTCCFGGVLAANTLLQRASVVARLTRVLRAPRGSSWGAEDHH